MFGAVSQSAQLSGCFPAGGCSPVPPRGLPACLTAPVPPRGPPRVLPPVSTLPPLHARAAFCSAAASLAPPGAEVQARPASFHLGVLCVSSVPHRHTDTSRIPPFSFQLSRAKSRVSLWGLTHTADPRKVTECASLAQRGDSTGVGRAVLPGQTGRRTDRHTLTPRPHKQPRSLQERGVARHKQEMPRHS